MVQPTRFEIMRKLDELKEAMTLDPVTVNINTNHNLFCFTNEIVDGEIVLGVHSVEDNQRLFEEGKNPILVGADVSRISIELKITT